MARSKITEKGRAVTIDAVCNADKPPVKSKTAATAPMLLPQKIRVRGLGFWLPPVTRVQITRVAESAEVTK